MRRTIMCVVMAGVMLAITSSGMSGTTISDAISNAGGDLVNAQSLNGSWPGDADFSGAIVAGLVNAYRVTGQGDYLTTAQAGGNFIKSYALVRSGSSTVANYLGDEAYGLMTLSQTSATPSSNAWRTELDNFYGTTVPGGIGGTSGYAGRIIDFYVSTYSDHSQAVYYLAEHSVAASYVDAADKGIWRNSLIQTLGQESDGDSFPVYGLGAAVWALAKTGPLDSTLVNPSAPAGSLWDQVKLSDLPAMLASEMVSSGAHAGSFYYRFDHANGGSGDAYGYTEDSVFPILGMVAANEQNPSLDFADEILSARLALASGVSPDGEVADHLWNGTLTRSVYAGETLQALPEPTTTLFLAVSGVMFLVRRRAQR